MTSYLHGVETIRQEAASSVKDATTSIIVAVVSVPTFLLDEEYQTLNTPIPISNYSHITKYAGKNVEGYTGYDTLYTIMTESEGALIYMINVFDKDTHVSTKSSETVYLTAGAYAIEELNVTDLTVTTSDGTECTLDTDYTFEDNVITVTSGGALADAESIIISYTYADPAQLSASDFIGEIDEDNVKSGLQAIYDIQSTYGDEVSLIVCPVYSALKSVRTAMETIETKLKAQSYYDSPAGTSINAAISGRTTAGDDVDLTSSSENGMIVYPWLYRYNSVTDADELRPASPAAVGMRVRVDRDRNVAKSISNTKSYTTTGVEVPIGFNLSDSTSDSNLLNAKGITTFINYKGSYYIWGTRNAVYPTESGIETFECVQRTASFIERSIQNSSFSPVADTITQGFIDDVLNMIEGFFNKLKKPSNQVIIDGSVSYNKENNTSEDLAEGHITFDYEFCPPPPAERITYYSQINIDLLDSLGS